MPRKFPTVKLPAPDMARRKRKEIRVGREFLNSDVNLLALVAVAEGSMTISDCNRQINLDFWIYGDDRKELDKEMAEKLEKLQRLTNAIRTMEDNLHVTYQHQLAQLEKKAKEKASAS